MLRRGFVAGLVVACTAAVMPASASAADAVVGLLDTGINPYHQVFRDTSARAYQYPGTYLPGYPADAQQLNLTLDAPNWKTAVKTDCALWRSLKPGQLYWIPGTRIVGAISFTPANTLKCSTGTLTGDSIVLDNQGHGTMTASRAASSAYGACRTCLIVSAQFPTTVDLADPGSSLPPALAGIEWLGKNSTWIDAESHSWGPLVFGSWEPTGQAGVVTGNPQLARDAEASAKKHLAFWASGNGLGGREGLLGVPPTEMAAQHSPSVIPVGGEDSGYVTLWSGLPPLVVSDVCASWGAISNSMDQSGDSVGSGTSAATPFAAGGSAQLLLEARTILGDPSTGVHDGVVAQGPAGLVPSGPLADGVLTLAEWKDLLLKTASPRPKGQFEDGPPCDTTAAPYNPEPVKWADVPAGFPEYLDIGYGAVDAEQRDLAYKVLRGEAPMPDRSQTDAFFAADGQARSGLHTVYTLGDDGSGGG